MEITADDVSDEHLAALLQLVPEYVPTIEETIKASGAHRQSSKS